MDIDQAALTQCIDIKTGTWSDEIGSTIGVEFEQYFPNPVPAETPVGRIKEDVAALLGLSCDTLVLAGTSDAIAAMNASGLVRLGEATEVAGTSSLVFAGTETPPDYHTVGAQKAQCPVFRIYSIHLSALPVLHSSGILIPLAVILSD